MNKKAIAILGGVFILIVGVLGFVIYSRSNKKSEIVTEKPAQSTEETASTTPVETPTPITNPTETKAVRLSDEAVLSPILTYQQDGISYFNRAGQLFQTDFQISNGSVLLSNKRAVPIDPKLGLSKIFWPPTGNYFIALSTSDSIKRWYMFNPNINQYTELPRQLYSIDWLPNGEQVVYIWVDDTGKSNMSIANPDLTGYRKLIDMFEPDNFIDVSPDGLKVAFYRNQNQDPTKNTINIVNVASKQVTGVVKEGYNRGTNWSPDSRKFLFNKRDPATQRFSLWLADTVTGEVKPLGVMSSVNKAVWSQDSQLVYVGEPIRGNADIGLTEDNLAIINTSTGMKEIIATGAPVDMQDLFLSSDKTMLFFRNAQDNYLYHIKLGS